jgi:hypothetical protein
MTERQLETHVRSTKMQLSARAFPFGAIWARWVSLVFVALHLLPGGDSHCSEAKS